MKTIRITVTPRRNNGRRIRILLGREMVYDVTLQAQQGLEFQTPFTFGGLHDVTVYLGAFCIHNDAQHPVTPVTVPKVKKLPPAPITMKTIKRR